MLGHTCTHVHVIVAIVLRAHAASSLSLTPWCRAGTWFPPLLSKLSIERVPLQVTCRGRMCMAPANRAPRKKSVCIQVINV